MAKAYRKPLQRSKEWINGWRRNAQGKLRVIHMSRQPVQDSYRGVVWELIYESDNWPVNIGDLVEIDSEFAPVIGGQPPLHDEIGRVWIEGERKALIPRDFGLEWVRPSKRPERTYSYDEPPDYRYETMAGDHYDFSTFREGIRTWQDKVRSCLPHEDLTFRIINRWYVGAFDEAGKIVGQCIGDSGLHPDKSLGEKGS